VVPPHWHETHYYFVTENLFSQIVEAWEQYSGVLNRSFESNANANAESSNGVAATAPSTADSNSKAAEEEEEATTTQEV
jgi:uridine phosphorylase